MRNEKTNSRRELRGGFTLLEVMLALAIFSLVVVALAVALTHTIDAAIEAQRETQVRLNLESKLAEARQQPLSLGRSSLTSDSATVTYEKEMSLLDLKNAKDQPLNRLYRLTIRARWQAGGKEQVREAEVYVYQ